MSVYVDRARLRFRSMTMSHMIADAPDELHAMADAIGLKREWFQEPPKASFWHYDVAAGRLVRAIRFGAIDCDRKIYVSRQSPYLRARSRELPRRRQGRPQTTLKIYAPATAR